MNLGVSLDSLRFCSSDNIVYIKINLAILSDEGAFLNPFIFWINVFIKIAASHSDKLKGVLYTRVVKSSLWG